MGIYVLFFRLPIFMELMVSFFVFFVYHISIIISFPSMFYKINNICIFVPCKTDKGI